MEKQFFRKILKAFYKMETQKVKKSLNDLSNYPPKFATTKQYLIDSETKGEYKKENPIQFITYSIKSSLCDYCDTYILVIGDITIAGSTTNEKSAFKNCTPLKAGRTEINDIFVDNADYFYIAIHMYNLTEYSDKLYIWKFIAV